ncbi:F0F1 ATP synthase subunit delta [Candidatus Parcubacteria bacterium]|nr:F0F1 ATP synthase subunit delta [Candidatus Parcubacteria bacterium]
MRRGSRRQLARTFVALLGRHPLPRLIQALADEVRRCGLAAETDLLLNDIQHELLAQKGYLEAEVVTARPLGEAVMNQVKRLLEDATGAKTVRLNTARDESLLGGLVARTPELEIDLSVKKQLSRLEV